MPGVIQQWDLSVLSWLRSCHDPAAIWTAWLVATLAWKGGVFWLIAAALWLKGSRKTAVQMIIALLVGVAEAGILKGLVLRPRPDLYASQQLNIPMPELLSTTHSFPSGHTLLVAAAAAVVIFTYKDWRGWLAGLFVVAIGVTRVFQGMHWPSDVILSVVLGAVAAFVAVKVSGLPLIERFTGQKRAGARAAGAEVTPVAGAEAPRALV